MMVGGCSCVVCVAKQMSNVKREPEQDGERLAVIALFVILVTTTRKKSKSVLVVSLPNHHTNSIIRKHPMCAVFFL